MEAKAPKVELPRASPTAGATLSPVTGPSTSSQGSLAYPSSILLDRIPSLQSSLRLYASQQPRREPQFRMTVRQQPRHGSAFGEDGTNTKSTRPTPLDAPLVCELTPSHKEDE